MNGFLKAGNFSLQMTQEQTTLNPDPEEHRAGDHTEKRSAAGKARVGRWRLGFLVGKTEPMEVLRERRLGWVIMTNDTCNQQVGDI